VKRFVPFLALVVALSLGAAVSAAATATTPKQLTTSFKRTTGQKLLVNKLKSTPGSYVAYDLGTPSISSRAKWGTFTIYVVTAADAATQVTKLLSDTHTGMLGTPTAAKIYWEQGSTLQGTPFWMAKRQYGTNVVVQWIGSQPVKKTDASWKRLHTALMAATK
jgi:hypothetical protein